MVHNKTVLTEYIAVPNTLNWNSHWFPVEFEFQSLGFKFSHLCRNKSPFLMVLRSMLHTVLLLLLDYYQKCPVRIVTKNKQTKFWACKLDCLWLCIYHTDFCTIPHSEKHPKRKLAHIPTVLMYHINPGGTSLCRLSIRWKHTLLFGRCFMKQKRVQELYLCLVTYHNVEAKASPVLNKLYGIYFLNKTVYVWDWKGWSAS